MNIPVFYDPRMSAADNASYSPSAGKPAAVVTDWILRRLRIELRPVEPLTPSVIALAHDSEYVNAVLGRRADNGFDNRSKAVAESLPFTTGSMVAAAAHAVKAQARNLAGIACSPSSGFHHAGHRFGGGYCTFNGLMVAALYLRKIGLVKRVAILDCDHHYGNGTEDIIEQLGLHDWIDHRTLGLEVGFWARKSSSLAGNLANWVKQTCARPARDGGFVLLYQAGADQHADDPLGGLLTTEQMRLRDRAVFRTCWQYGIPVAFNLAGGYQRDASGSIEPVLALHRQTMQVCAEVYNGEHP